jgi:hypothetical protein
MLVLEIPITYENTDDTDVSPECEFIPRSLPKQPDSMENEKKVSSAGALSSMNNLFIFCLFHPLLSSYL